MGTDFASLPPAVYLRGEQVGLRAVLRSDAGDVDIWNEDPVPILPDAAEAMLVAGERVPWGGNPVMRLMVVRLETGSVLGSVVVRRFSGRTSRLTLKLGERIRNRESVEAEVFRLVVPWLLGEVGLMTVVLRLPADETSTITAAERAGMRIGVRLREQVSRGEKRVDLLILERVNQQWGRPWRRDNDG